MNIKDIDFKKTYKTGEKRNIMGWVYDVEEAKYIRVRRVIYSRFWNVIHNVIAHPMLSIYRPLGEILHEWTAEKMYKGGPQSLEESSEQEITAIMD